MNVDPHRAALARITRKLAACSGLGLPPAAKIEHLKAVKDYLISCAVQGDHLAAGEGEDYDWLIESVDRVTPGVEYTILPLRVRIVKNEVRAPDAPNSAAGLFLYEPRNPACWATPRWDFTLQRRRGFDHLLASLLAVRDDWAGRWNNVRQAWDEDFRDGDGKGPLRWPPCWPKADPAMYENVSVSTPAPPAGATPAATTGSTLSRKHFRVLISYSHDSPAHAEKVRQLADLLRKSGVDCECDQYHESPPQGWPLWMKQKIEEWAEFVVMICTPTYEKRVSGKEKPGSGLGAVYEGHLIRQAVYESGCINEKFIPVVFSEEDLRSIPIEMRAYTHYALHLPDGKEKLLRRLTGQPLIVKPPIGEVPLLPPRPG